MKNLNTPSKIQDYINSIPFNFEEDGETLKSPKTVMQTGSAHCLEGAILAGLLLQKAGYKPFLMQLVATEHDFDHAVTVFKEGKFYGAISKTNHYVLRYREPIYKSPRELAMTYFHEYFLNKNRKKTMRSFSTLVPFSKFKRGWENSDKDLWYIEKMLYKAKHENIVPKAQIKKLRLVDPIEVVAGSHVDWKPKIKGFKDPNLL